VADQYCPNAEHDTEEGKQSIYEICSKCFFNVNGPYLSKKDTHKKATSVECVISDQELNDATSRFAHG